MYVVEWFSQNLGSGSTYCIYVFKWEYGASLPLSFSFSFSIVILLRTYIRIYGIVCLFFLCVNNKCSHRSPGHFSPFPLFFYLSFSLFGRRFWIQVTVLYFFLTGRARRSTYKNFCTERKKRKKEGKQSRYDYDPILVLRVCLSKQHSRGTSFLYILPV